MRTVDKIEESIAISYVGSLRGKLFNEIKEDVGDIDIIGINDWMKCLASTVPLTLLSSLVFIKAVWVVVVDLVN